MNVLVPVLTAEKECSDEFVEAIGKPVTVIALFVVDKEKMGEVPAAFIGTRIKKAEECIEELKNSLPTSVSFKDYFEWGSWAEKIENIARLENVDKIVMAECTEAELLKPVVKSLGIELVIVGGEL